MVDTSHKTPPKPKKKAPSPQTIAPAVTHKEEATPPSSSVTLLNVILLHILISGIILYGLVHFWPRLQPRLFPLETTHRSIAITTSEPSSSAHIAQLAQLELRLSALQREQKRIATTSVSSHSDNNDPNISAETIQRLKLIETQLSEQQTQDSTKQELAALQAELMLLKGLISQQVEHYSSAPQYDIRIFVAFQKLQAHALSGHSFQQSLNDFRSLAPQDTLQTPIEALAKHAEYGRVSSYLLVQEFDALQASYTESTEDAAPSLRNKVMANLSGFISIRRIDNEGNSADSVLTRIHTALRQEAWSDALSEFNQLPQAMQQHWGAWKQKLYAHQQIPFLLNDLELAISGLLLSNENTNDAS